MNASWGDTGSTPRLCRSKLLDMRRRGSNDVIPGQSLSNAASLHQLPSMPSNRRLDVDNQNGHSGSFVDDTPGLHHGQRNRQRSRIYDDPSVIAGYASVPLLEVDRLPRGGISIETQAVGRVQFGIPPETIKDSMILGLGVPSVYIVPIERFCREMGPALGINLAEFEFPAYFNYFVRQKRCTLVVDSTEAEQDIRAVFGETLLGPGQFRNRRTPTPNVDEDFDPQFPEKARPNFYKEFYHFRTSEESTNFQELTIDVLIDFCHFEGSQLGLGSSGAHLKLGIPPVAPDKSSDVERVETRRKSEDAILHDSHVSFHEDVRGGESEEIPTTPTQIRRTCSDPDFRSTAGDAPRRRSLSPVQGGEKPGTRRGSIESTFSFVSKGTRFRDGNSMAGASFMLPDGEEDESSRKSWMYSKVKWLGEVATVYPSDTTAEQKQKRDTRRVEIFKMTGGTEYVVHDIDDNNVIIGKARFSGTVRVPDEIAVEGFLAKDDHGATTSLSPNDDESLSDDEIFTNEESGRGPLLHDSLTDSEVHRNDTPPTFHPPSFGVTVLGNSHGFDKNGSTSGYVLWINGRGVMIDPPPYSSATLEREGIRPQMIMAIIITHCHADHDAGTFQKVMTGSRVAIITTPTIYRSFIRKYAALSGLSSTLLRQSHRHRPAIIGQPLKFQGATFHFTYTLHTIPCIAFKVEWRGRSMVFTGDHLNNPPVIDSLQQQGVLTKERADDLRHLPLQECDALLHESGAPPIHTPLWVLKELPESVKERLYVVHTSALPPDSDLRVAPTGTAGTIRLDELRKIPPERRSQRKLLGGMDPASLDDGGYPNLTVYGEFVPPDRNGLKEDAKATNIPPLVMLRPTCVSDSWFILNLLSAVPFLSSLSYANTMEVLEIAQVEMFCANEVVVSAHRRSEVLCVVWEGTCMEVDDTETGEDSGKLHGAGHTDQYKEHVDFDASLDNFICFDSGDHPSQSFRPVVWHAGDWTGPVALQPEMERSAEHSKESDLRDIMAVSEEGVKVIMLNMKDLYKILKTGSKLFRKYLALKAKQAAEEAAVKADVSHNERNLDHGATTDSGPAPDAWYAYDSVLEVIKCNSALAQLNANQKRHLESLAEGPRYFEHGQYLWQVGETVAYAFLIVAGTAGFAWKAGQEGNANNQHPSMSHRTGNMSTSTRREGAPKIHVEEDKQLCDVPPDSEYARLEIGLQLRVEEMELDVYDQREVLLPKERRVRNARDRFANKVLSRLYSRRAYTPSLVFSRGHLLSDTSRMVSGNLAHIHHTGGQGRKSSISHSLAGEHHCHTSNMAAGPDGCVVMVFPRSSLVQFLDGNPGVLLSLLGTQVVV